MFVGPDDTLSLDPVAQFLSLALADDAFEARNLTTPEAILGVRVPAIRESIQLRWKKTMLDVPIFRRAVRATAGIRTSPVRALPYESVSKYLKRLGRNFGFPQVLSPYCIRRETGNKLDSKSFVSRLACMSLIDQTGVATVAERNLALGHKRARVFESFYLTQKRDVQAAYVGCPHSDAEGEACGSPRGLS
jgi:hypothetical protein